MNSETNSLSDASANTIGRTVDEIIAADCAEWLRTWARFEYERGNRSNGDKFYLCANIIVEYYAPTLDAIFNEVA